jgi:hypothetical protein
MPSLHELGGKARQPRQRSEEGALLNARDALAAALDRQIEAVRASNPAELATVTRAARAATALTGELALGEFQDALIQDSKPRLLLRFRVGTTGPLADLGPDVVLKVYGDRPRGEGAALRLWRDRGVNTPRVRFGEYAECPWVALEHLLLSPVAPHRRSEILALTRMLAGFGARMHEPADELAPVLRPLDGVMLPRWEAAVRTLRAAEYAVPDFWHARARSAYKTSDPTPLHGDLGLPNIAHDAAGRLVVYDASALRGPASFDAARWAARLGSSAVAPPDVAKLWASVEGIPWGAVEDELLAVECVLEAGSRVSVGTASGCPRNCDMEAQGLLDQARLLIGH